MTKVIFYLLTGFISLLLFTVFLLRFFDDADGVILFVSALAAIFLFPVLISTIKEVFERL